MQSFRAKSIPKERVSSGLVILAETSLGSTRRNSTYENKFMTSHAKAYGTRKASELPTLGLTKYDQIILEASNVNPYRYNKRHDQLLVQRERERETDEIKNLVKAGHSVHEKEWTFKPNRSGVMREIKTIEMAKTFSDWGATSTKHSTNMDDS